MKQIVPFAAALLMIGLAQAGQEKTAQEGGEKKKKMGTRPPVSVTYHVAAGIDAKDRDSLGAALMNVKSVKSALIDAQGDSVTVQFDSHVVSYHQVAQAIVDAGAQAGRKYAPSLKVRVPDYAKADNAGKVDAIFAGKRLNQRVRLEPIDKAKGEFVLRFLPLELDPSNPAPQGFNGGHLNHPIHDAPPRGLGLQFIYVGESESRKGSAK